MITSHCLRGFYLSMLSYVFVFCVFFILHGIDFVFVSGSRQLSGSSDPLSIEMLSVPLSSFVLTERQTCYYTDDKVQEYVKAMRIYSPRNFGKPNLVSVNFYFVKLEYHAGSTFLLDFNKRGPQRLKSKITSSSKILNNEEHFEL